ncbi:MAG: hypothetical protein ACE145_12890 [Terriglobia bacterium]
MARTDWAERFAAAFASTPLADECVFLNPKHLDGGVQKEVCDLLFVLRKDALVVQMKCQEDPVSRSGGKLERWVRKQAEAALSQLQGAIRKIADSDFWCEHPRKGKIVFAKGALTPIYGVVLTEHFQKRITLESEFPLVHTNVPIAYFTVNDFLNLINELRAFPEIVSYLRARSTLPADVVAGVGGENILFQHYLLNDESFANWTTYDAAAHFLDSLQPQLRAAMKIKQEADRPACEVEKLLRGLASAPTIAGSPKNDWHLRIQEELLDLHLAERRMLGKSIIETRENVGKGAQSTCFSHKAVWSDRKPDFLYICASSRGMEREQLVTLGRNLLRAGLAFYGKTQGLACIERDNGNYLWFYESCFDPTEGDKTLGDRVFGSLKHSLSPLKLLSEL